MLEPVLITQSRLNDHKIAAYQLPVDSTMLSLASNGSVTDLLRKQGIGHIRSYGPGGLALPAFRGTGSSHTAVLWDGIDLVSPLSGQLDLSLVPASIFDNATIETGGSSSLSGSGSIGASIQFSNKIRFGEGLRITAASHFGSFGSQYLDAGIRLSKNRFGSTTKVFSTKSDNDFRFLNTGITPAETQRREHAAFDQHGMLQHLYYQSQHAGIFSLKLWYQRSEYQIPNPIGIFRAAKATEQNEFYRGIAKWNHNINRLNLNYQAAFMGHDLDYADPVINEFSSNRYHSSIHDLEADYHFNNKSQITTGIRYTWEKGDVESYGNVIPVRNRIAIFSAYKVDVAKWNFSLSGREEFVNGKPQVFSPTVSAKYNITGQFNTFTNLSRNYRIPTFNDLYWKGSGAKGNPNLNTEESLSAEAGFAFSNKYLSFKNVLFTNHVDDWIQWSPNGSWTPQNIKKVWSRGLEFQMTFQRTYKQFRYSSTAQYSFTKATNERLYGDVNSNEKGKQLLLTPFHEGSLMINGDWKKHSIRIVNAYTGKQFNDSDNTRYNVVDDYFITNVWLSRTIDGKQIRVTLVAEMNNVFDVAYVARPGYPLPGRNYKVGIQFTFNKPE